MDRRSFLSWVGVGFLASSLPVAIAACSPSTDTDVSDAPSEPPPPPPGAVARDDGFVPLGPTQALELDGFLTGDIAGLAIIVAKGPNDELLGLESTCPHAACIVEWNDSQFECPCHGSKFNPDGTVANGPASTDLSTVEVKIEEDVVLVKST